MTKLLFSALITTFLLSISTLNALPAQVILIRHAEKPSSGSELSLRGQERAAALAPYILGTQVYTKYGPPVAIFAQNPKNDKSSIRSIQTVAPLSAALGLTTNHSFTRKEYKGLVDEITTNPLYTGKTVLICYEHKTIPEIAQKLGVKFTPKWPGHVYDWVWVITFDSKNTPKLQIFPQQLMYGDSYDVSISESSSSSSN